MKTNCIPSVRASRIVALIAIVATLTIAGHAAPQVFDFKDPKGVNNVQFKLEED